MFRIGTGDIVTSYGNYVGDLYRCRLSFYPDDSGNVVIAGNRYRKVMYETGYTIAGIDKVLDLPGEQHFLLHYSNVRERFDPRKAFDLESCPHKSVCLAFKELMLERCRLPLDAHGLTGSGMLGCAHGDSDLDWVVYAPYSPAFKGGVMDSGHCTSALTFLMSHALRKYSVFTGFEPHQLSALFSDRWKYFSFQNVPISLNFVDEKMLADDFLKPPRYIRRETTRAHVVDETGAYQFPRIVKLSRAGERFAAFSWLFMYAGAFRKGDYLEVSGTIVQQGSVEYLLVESPNDYIRNISAEERSSGCQK